MNGIDAIEIEWSLIVRAQRRAAGSQVVIALIGQYSTTYKSLQYYEVPLGGGIYRGKPDKAIKPGE